MIHRSKLPVIWNRKDAKGKPVSFSFKFVKKSTGEVIHILSATLTSEYFPKRCINVKIDGSDEIRTIRTITIIEFNGEEVYV
jgi:hypothetical protein